MPLDVAKFYRTLYKNLAAEKPNWSFVWLDAVHKRGLCHHVVSVRLFVRHVRRLCRNE